VYHISNYPGHIAQISGWGSGGFGHPAGFFDLCLGVKELGNMSFALAVS
jgi:hypothetical protein